MSASPLKRRAALATLDANAMTTTTPTSTTTSPIKTTQQQHAAADDVTCPSSASKATTAAPSFPSLSGTKRPNLHQQQQHHSPSTSATTSFKKSRLDSSHPAENTQPVPSSTQDSRSRTHSPDTSSVFDSSCAAEDASWSTAATEPDMLYSAASRPRVVALTREQAREKAEILRLRLGLASYKLRTGQISIPLADLQAKPLLPARFDTSPVSAGTPASLPDHAEAEANAEGGEEENDAEQDEVIAATPPLEEQQEKQGNKPVAASGLLSLAMGSG